METLIQELLRRSGVAKWFSYGKRWILLVPIAWILLSLTVLVSTQFELLRDAFELPSPQAIVADPYFITVSAAVVLISLTAFLIMTRRRPPKDRFVIVVAKFYPVSAEGEGAASEVQDRIWEEINQRMKNHGIPSSVKQVLRGTPQDALQQEAIDPRSEVGIERARLLGRHYRAHMVVCGTVRRDEEFYIKSAFQNRCLWCADRYEHTRNRAIFTENRTHLACDATPPTRF
jgi:hypothetical protein